MRLKVENLAKIKNASIEVKNLTLFIGQNSTNKSYMAHAIYELYKEISTLSGSRSNWNKKNKIIYSVLKQIDNTYFEYAKSLERKFSEDIDIEQIDENEYEEHIWTIVSFKLNDQKYFNELQNQINMLVLDELTKIINQSFNTDTNIIKALFINTQEYADYQDEIKVFFDTPLEYFEEELNDMINSFFNKIIGNIINDLYKTLDAYHTSFYFPASRTGFVLTQEEIYAGIFRDKFRGQASSTKLGEPTIDFIQTFADIKMGKNSWQQKDSQNTKELITFLENNIIKGSIGEDTTSQGYTNHHLDVAGKKIDLHLSSSATLETLPFIVFLKNTRNIKKTFFVIEEPEAHLHPKAQIQMAKFIVMLSNAGAKVLVTTHSDYILGEINNCIKRYELEKDDISIDKENVSVYLFKNKINETIVKKMNIDKFGISNENFDEALDELLEESGNLTDKILENEK